MLDNNRIEGDDSAICNNPSGPQYIAYMVADCNEITCDCCTLCCSNPTCNNADLVANLDDSYTRNQYVFSEDVVFDLSHLPAN